MGVLWKKLNQPLGAVIYYLHSLFMPDCKNVEPVTQSVVSGSAIVASPGSMLELKFWPSSLTYRTTVFGGDVELRYLFPVNSPRGSDGQ